MNLEASDRAEGWAREGLAIAEARVDDSAVVDAHNLLGIVAAARQDYDVAMAEFALALAACEALADAARAARIRANLALAALLAGETARAEAWFREALAQDAASESKRGIGFCLRGFAGLAAARGDDRRAARLFGAAEALYEAIGEAVRPVIRAALAPTVVGVRARLGDAAFVAAWAEGRMLPMADAVAEALALGRTDRDP